MISLKHLLKKGNDTLLVMMGEDHLSFETDMSVLFVYEFDWNFNVNVIIVFKLQKEPETCRENQKEHESPKVSVESALQKLFGFQVISSGV